MRTAALALLAFLPAWAQQTPVFHATSQLATVRFHVVRNRQYVTSLKPSDVVLLEDGAPRSFTLFENAAAAPRTLPVETTLLFDTSGSVLHEGLLDPLVFKQALIDGLPGVSLAVYGFTDRLVRFTPPTRDYEALRGAFASLPAHHAGDIIKLALPPKRGADPRGATWLYEAVAAAARDAASGPMEATRLMLVFSDGFPSTDTRPDDIAVPLRDTGVAIYPVVLGHWQLAEQINAEQERLTERSHRDEMPSSKRLDSLNEKAHQIAEFKQLADLTGGQSFDPREITLDVLKQVLAFMAGQVRSEYVIGFAPEVSATPRRHKLEVRLREKDTGRLLGGTRTLVH
ncbi:MAG: VWA domain-containing protein [Acidobacteria bacterium]|nr:VWA domain-containing protein [Acidobacteriota bacterium]